MDTINACPRGHRYRASLIQLGRSAVCPICDQIALVALAYGDCQNPPRGCRLLTFRTEILSSFQLCSEVMSLVPSYNAWCVRTVLRELGPVFPKLSGIEFGREGSPVIYADIPYWTHQASEWNGGGMGERILDEERKEAAKAFLDAMSRAQAHELTFDGNKARAWWD
jgi:hypothetical protein